MTIACRRASSPRSRAEIGARHYLDELLGEQRSAARRRSLEQRLEQIGARGYDEGPSDTVGGVVDVCFPLFDQFGVIAALNVVYLRQRDAKVGVPAARTALAETTAAISRSLGWSPGRRRSQTPPLKVPRAPTLKAKRSVTPALLDERRKGR